MISNVKNIIEEATAKSMKLREGIIRGYWSDIVGKLYENSQPLFIKNDILYVIVENSVFLHHMTINKNKYLKKINEILKGNYIKDIKLKTSKIDKEMQITLNEMYINNNKKEELTLEVSKNIKIKSEEDITKYIEKLKKASLEREKYLLAKGLKKCKNCGNIFETTGDLCIFCSKK